MPCLFGASRVQPFLRPSALAPPLFVTQTASSTQTEAPLVLPQQPGDLLKLYECGHIQWDGWPAERFLIWPLALIP